MRCHGYPEGERRGPDGGTPFRTQKAFRTTCSSWPPTSSFGLVTPVRRFAGSLGRGLANPASDLLGVVYYDPSACERDKAISLGLAQNLVEALSSGAGQGGQILLS